MAQSVSEAFFLPAASAIARDWTDRCAQVADIESLSLEDKRQRVIGWAEALANGDERSKTAQMRNMYQPYVPLAYFYRRFANANGQPTKEERRSNEQKLGYDSSDEFLTAIRPALGEPRACMRSLPAP